MAGVPPHPSPPHTFVLKVFIALQLGSDLCLSLIPQGFYSFGLSER